jgi:hypothetical protein
LRSRKALKCYLCLRNEVLPLSQEGHTPLDATAGLHEHSRPRASLDDLARYAAEHEGVVLEILERPETPIVDEESEPVAKILHFGEEIRVGDSPLPYVVYVTPPSTAVLGMRSVEFGEQAGVGAFVPTCGTLRKYSSSPRSSSRTLRPRPIHCWL